MTTDCGSQPLVTREQAGVERFRESNIDGVKRREVAAQTPNARQKEIMRVAANGKIGKIGKRHAAAFVIDFPNGGVAAENLHHLDIEQVRRMQCLLRRIEKTALHRFRPWRAKQDFQQC